MLAEPVGGDRLAVEARHRRIEPQAIPRGSSAAAAAGRAGRHRSPPPAPPRFGRRSLLQLGLLAKQIQGPGHRIGGGLVAGEIEGRGIVDRQRDRLVARKALAAARGSCRSGNRRDASPPSRSRTIAPSVWRRKTGRAARAARSADRDQRQAEQRLHPRLADALHRRGDMVHRFAAGQPRVAAEQGVRDDRHRRRVASAAMSRAPVVPRSAPSPRPTSAEDRHQRVDRGRREAGGDDLALRRATARRPRSAGRGRWSGRADALDESRLLVIGGIVEQHALDPRRASSRMWTV